MDRVRRVGRVEGVVDLHLADLATRLGLGKPDIRDAGPDISTRLRKGS